MDKGWVSAALPLPAQGSPPSTAVTLRPPKMLRIFDAFLQNSPAAQNLSVGIDCNGFRAASQSPSNNSVHSDRLAAFRIVHEVEISGEIRSRQVCPAKICSQDSSHFSICHWLKLVFIR